MTILSQYRAPRDSLFPMEKTSFQQEKKGFLYLPWRW